MQYLQSGVISTLLHSSLSPPSPYSPPWLNLASWADGRVCASLAEASVDTAAIQVDKLFSAEWLSLPSPTTFPITGTDSKGGRYSDDVLLLGSKCNRLLLVDAKSHRMKVAVDLAAVAETLRSAELRGDATLNLNNIDQSEWPQFINEAQRLSPCFLKSACTGIHAVAVSPSKHLIAVGAGSPTEITLFELPEFELWGTCKGHTDMVFSLAFTNDETLISSSRDTSIKVWSIYDDACFSTSPRIRTFYPSSSSNAHGAKVRDLKFVTENEEYASLGADGFVCIWDSNTHQKTCEHPLLQTAETVCLHHSPEYNCYSIGSQGHISFLDPRCGIVNTVDSLDDNWGVRSISQKGKGLLAVGGGLGRISFFCLRAGKYLNVGEDGSQPFFTASPGYLNRDHTYLTHFFNTGTVIRNAIYSLSFDKTGRRLAVAGGPLQVHITGSYFGIWST